MKRETRRMALTLCFAVVLSFVAVAALALVEFSEGNTPVRNMGWPNGAEAVANLPERVMSVSGPWGGVSRFLFRCENTAQFNEALRKFSAIRAPRIAKDSRLALDGQGTADADGKTLLLVVHDGPRPPEWFEHDRKAGKEPARVDWVFEVRSPLSYYMDFSGPLGHSLSDHPRYGQPVPPPRIDVYVGGGGPIEWEKVNVPNNVRVVDLRMESAPADVKNGGVVCGAVYDMATYQCVAGATVTALVQITTQPLKAVASTHTDENGAFEITAIPPGYY